ncbi:MAG: phosphotransferase [Alphaproteobacteria bacterium]|nr:phosphotransferase [Alphaproteobacteria bacterium]
MAWQTIIENVLNMKESVGSLLIPIMEGGSDSKLYAFDTEGKVYIARVFSKDRDKIDKEREVFFLKMASDNDITPPLFYASAENNLVIQQRIHKKNHDFSEKSRVRNLFHCIKQLHSLSVPQNVPSHDNHYAMWAFDASKNMHNKKYEGFLNTVCYQRVLAALKKHETTAVTHNDLNPRNILWDGERLFFIDFENASIGDPYFDLAALMLFYTFSISDSHQLFTDYLGYPPTAIMSSKLHLMTIVCLATYGLWYLGFLYEGHKDRSQNTLDSILQRIAEGADYLTTRDDYIELGLRLFDKATADLHNQDTTHALFILEQ